MIDYFFNSDLNFRAIVIDKSQLDHKSHNQNHNDFYDKMYYQLLNKKINPEFNYNIYIDIKDTHSYLKARNLKTYLERDYNNIRNLQVIRSYESELMQLTDVLMGAINYRLRGLNKVTAKNNIIEKKMFSNQWEYIKEQCRESLDYYRSNVWNQMKVTIYFHIYPLLWNGFGCLTNLHLS